MMNRISDHDEIVWVKDVLATNFKSMEIDHITKLGEGWMNRAYLINRELVFRFPLNEEGALDTQKEMRILPKLQKQMTLDIPDFIYHGKQANGYPFVGYKILQGKPLDERHFNALSIKVKEKIADQLAEFITQMSSFDITLAKALGVSEIDFYQDYVAIFQEVKEKFFSKMTTEMQGYLTLQFTSYLENKDNFFYTPKLLHADLSLNHLLFDRAKQQLTGIIDFGDLQIGDPDYEYHYLLEECGEAFTIEVMEDRGEENIPYKLKKTRFFLTVDNVKQLLEGQKKKQSGDGRRSHGESPKRNRGTPLINSLRKHRQITDLTENNQIMIVKRDKAVI